jgi:hypothetical protein
MDATEYFGNASAALFSSGNTSDPTHMFSDLKNLDSYREIDGALHLRMSWATPISTPTSCVDIRIRNPSATSGNYVIQPAGSQQTISVYCDMVTDGGGYTYYACQNCPSVSDASVSVNGCMAVGLQMVVPRTKAHWVAMFDWISSWGGTVQSFFAAVPGIYKPGSGYGPCSGGGNGIMNSNYCTDPNGWRALDGGKWWLMDTAFGEPNGDYTGGCLLVIWGLTYNFAANEYSWGFNDGNCQASTGTRYVCSTNDWNTGLPTSLATNGRTWSSCSINFPAPSAVFNDFVQISNPVSDEAAARATGYFPINVSLGGALPNVFNGLRHSCSGSALVDGDSAGCQGSFALGSYQPLLGGGLAGPNNIRVAWVTLHAIIGSGLLLCPAGTYSFAGATVCSICIDGQYNLAGATSCMNCPGTA